MILHLIRADKFTSGIIDLLKDSEYKNVFLVFFKEKESAYINPAIWNKNIVHLRYSVMGLIKTIYYLKQSDKIILHGFFNKKIAYLIWMLNYPSRCYWCIWGGDLYSYPFDRGIWKYVKKNFLSRIRGVITQIEGDYDLSRDVYGVNAKYYHCLMYQSNILHLSDNNRMIIHKKCTNILVGNCADCDARHKEIIEKLINSVDVTFHVPISYGDMEYAKRLSQELKYNNVILYKNFIPENEYMNMLDKIDIAIFAYKRQQACGNIIQLLGRGATVYIDSEISTWKWLNSIGIHVKDINHVYSGMIEVLTENEQKENIDIIRKYASIENLKNQWDEILRS